MKLRRAFSSSPRINESTARSLRRRPRSPNKKDQKRFIELIDSWTSIFESYAPGLPNIQKKKELTLEQEIEAHKLSFETVQNLDPNIRLIYDDESFDEEEKPYVAIMCPYRGVPRKIHPDVCRLHNKMKDPECFSCKRYKGEE